MEYETQIICSYTHANPADVTSLVRELGLTVTDIEYTPDLDYEQD